jgi:hypothetical protein
LQPPADSDAQKTTLISKHQFGANLVNPKAQSCQRLTGPLGAE